MMMAMKQQVQQLLEHALVGMGITDTVPVVDVPENPEHGDYTTNIAMLLSKRLGQSPVKIALDLKNAIRKDQTLSYAGIIDHVEIAGPGFLNIYLSEASLINQLGEVLKNKKTYGFVTKSSFSEGTPASLKLKTGTKTGSKITGKISGDLSAGTVSTTGQKQGKNLRKTAADKNTERQNASDMHNVPQDFIPEKAKKRIMVEFAHPNTHKAFHIGHLRNITTGESIVRLFESQGHQVFRGNYQGDVGMHIAKALYALLELPPYKEQRQKVTGIHQRVEFLGKAYAAGSAMFEQDPNAQAFIKDLNALIYASAQRFAREEGRDPGTTDYVALVQNHRYPIETVYTLWKKTRQWSLDYFETVYKRVYTHYDRLFFESECLSGVDRAKDAVQKGVLAESEGAIIFDGKSHGTDTRVFVNNLGLPTYEGKELALAAMETSEFGALDRLIHVVGPEQKSFFAVTFKVEELLGMVKPGMQHHLVYGWVRLKHGKMSSRLGNVILGEWLLDEAKKSIYKILEKSASTYSQEQKDDIAEKAAIAAVKYSFLRVGISSDIAFDLEASVSFDGDSGPYLQYTYARCKSVLRKANSEGGTVDHYQLNPEERTLVRFILQFPDVVRDAAAAFAPNAICTYLFHLAQQFNLFYAKHPIVGNDLRLGLTSATAQTMKNGLSLLGIETMEQM